MIQKVSEFELKLGMIQAFSYIDGTHIPLKLPMINSHDSFDYNEFYSINVQTICDSRRLFMDINMLTANYQYSGSNRDNLPLPIRM